MANAFDTAIDAAASTVRAVAGRLVTYSRGEASVELTAAVGSTRYEAGEAADVLVEHRTRDYLIAAADLDFGSGPVEPARDDEIRDTVCSAPEVAGVVLVCKVLGPPGEPPFRYCDPAHAQLRVHTVTVDTEAVE